MELRFDNHFEYWNLKLSYYCIVWEIGNTTMQSTIGSFNSLGNRHLKEPIEFTISFGHE
jgi:hypothetical protein